VAGSAAAALRAMDGGVPGGPALEVKRLDEGWAGEGDVARNSRRSAPSSPLPEMGRRRNADGGVEGGDECG
jgi:hypothetical protein